MKPENAFITSVHRQIRKLSPIYFVKMAHTVNRGIPDLYYELDGSVFWVEYKWRTSKPKRIFWPARQLTDLQRHWLLRAHKNKIKVGVIVGFPEGAFCFSGTSWLPEVPDPSQLPCLTRQDTAQWIIKTIQT